MNNTITAAAFSLFIQIQSLFKMTEGLIEELYESTFYSCFNQIISTLQSNYPHGKLTLKAGRTKGVIIYNDERAPARSFVLKVPFDINDLTETPLSYDYCKLEVYNYQAAVQDGVEDFFVETSFLDFLQDKTGRPLPVYLQEQALTFTEVHSSYKSSLHSYSRLQSFTSKYAGTTELPSIWLEDFITYYGEEQFDTLGTFIEQAGINDLHRGNVGYTIDTMAPVIFDFSGFEELSSSSPSINAKSSSYSWLNI